MAERKKLRMFSASSLRMGPQVVRLAKEIPRPRIAMSIGPLGKAPAGSSVVWYGVHAVEMLQEIMGTGAKKVLAKEDSLGVTAIIEYADRRRGIVQLNEGDYRYAVMAQNEKAMQFLNVDGSRLYTELLLEIRKFFIGGEPPVSFEQSLEVQAILNAIDDSVRTGREQTV